MNITSPTLTFPVESVISKIDCTDAVRMAMPHVKQGLIWLTLSAIILDIMQLIILTRAKAEWQEEIPCLGSIFVKGCILSVVWTFP